MSDNSNTMQMSRQLVYV